jgi:hypothetical protein
MAFWITCFVMPFWTQLNGLIHILKHMPRNGFLNHMLCNAILNTFLSLVLNFCHPGRTRIWLNKKRDTNKVSCTTRQRTIWSRTRCIRFCWVCALLPLCPLPTLLHTEAPSYRLSFPLWSFVFFMRASTYLRTTGDTVPLKLHGMTDDTLYTHYSSLSTVQANWGLKSLGRGDTIAWVTHCLSSLHSHFPSYFGLFIFILSHDN